MEVQVHMAWRVYYFQARAEAPRLMLRLCQVSVTPQFSSQALAKMSLSAIGQSENALKYQVAIHRTIDLKHHSDHWCLPIPMTTMLATIYEPPMHLKHSVKRISRQESFVSLAHFQII
jgi:hypothetical protein